ncbi:hypothetical protein ACJX0J_033623, partial [Zea mays]
EESNGKWCRSTKRGGTEDNLRMVERSRGRTTQQSPPSCPRTTSMSGQGVASKAWRGDGLSQPRREDLAMANRGIVTHRGFSNATLLAPSWYAPIHFLHSAFRRKAFAFWPFDYCQHAICQIYGDTVGFLATCDIFVACNECAFPMCRSRYEYECKEGNQCCPQCKTRYKRHKEVIYKFVPQAILYKSTDYRMITIEVISTTRIIIKLSLPSRPYTPPQDVPSKIKNRIALEHVSHDTSHTFDGNQQSSLT